MIGMPVSTWVSLVAGVTDMRRGFDGLAAIVQTALDVNPFGGHVFIFRGKRGDPINKPALLAMFRQVIANNRAGGWRKIKAARG